jgi:hypothetical protein
LGLYKSSGSSEEWPVDGEESARALLPQLELDIKEIAVPFWDALKDPSRVLEAVETNARWAKRSDSWKYRELTLILVERGTDAAIAYLTNNAKKFRGIDQRALMEQLQKVRVKGTLLI